jgi:surfactin synthase thioesterase subunit
MTYVLIPGAGGDGSYWQLVAAELRVRGHDTFAIDLPADDDDADIPDYADVVVDAIGDRRDVILVAQSMGGLSEFQRRVAQERVSITADEMPGGHILALSQPMELVDRLEAYTAQLDRGTVTR